jgi:uncharacterized protein YjbJ (UPF0337 family)
LQRGLAKNTTGPEFADLALIARLMFSRGQRADLADMLPVSPQLVMDVTMHWDRVEGNWKQIKGRVKTKWGKLTDDDLTAINGKREQLEGKLQERYGIAKDQARKEVDDRFRAQTW